MRQGPLRVYKWLNVAFLVIFLLLLLQLIVSCCYQRVRASWVNRLWQHLPSYPPRTQLLLIYPCTDFVFCVKKLSLTNRMLTVSVSSILQKCVHICVNPLYTESWNYGFLVWSVFPLLLQASIGNLSQGFFHHFCRVHDFDHWPYPLISELKMVALTTS